MPIYEYGCKKCGNGFELMRPLADRDKASKCPSCGSRSIARKLSVFSFARGAEADSFGDDFDPSSFGGGDDDFGGFDDDDDFDF